MPAGYGLAEPDGGSGLLPWEHVVERLAASRNFWICTTRPDGRPHAMPVWGLWLDGAIYFSTDAESRKGRNLLERPDVVVHLESGDDVVVVEGKAERETRRDALARFVEAYDGKYGYRVDVDNPAFSVLKVRPAVVLAWLEADFPGGATRWVL
jgi:PPOX class probable F420-dependent enzyme